MSDVSVVVCAYTQDRWLQLVEAIETLQRQTHLPREIIVVIDHNRSLLDQVKDRFPDLIIVENGDAPGLSGARGRGIEIANGEIIAFMDDDAAAAPDWLEALCCCYDDSDVIGVGGAIQPAWQSGRPGWFPPEFDWVVGCTYRGMPENISPVRNLIGANMSFRREIFEQVGDFSSEIGRVGRFPTGCEETELCIRARQFWPKKVFLYNPEALVTHRVPRQRAQFKYFLTRCFAEGLSKAIVSKLVGAEDGLSSERKYVLHTLPQGVLDSLKRAIQRREWAGIGQAAAIVTGVTVTTLGYFIGRLVGIKGISQLNRRNAPKLGSQNQKDGLDNPLRVLMVTPRYLPEMGGVENHVYQVGRRLAQAGVEVTVLTTDRNGRLPADEYVEGVRVIRVRAWPRSRDYYFAPGMYRLIKEGNWDLLHIQSYHTLVPPLAMIAGRRAGIPYVVTFHGGGHSSRLRNSLRVVQRALLRPLLARSERLIALARFETELYGKELRLPGERFLLIPNGCDLPSAPRPASPSAKNGVLIASVGRLERYKGHQRILAAMPHILQQISEARLWIAGSGPYEQDLRSLARKLGVEDSVLIRAIPPLDRQAMTAELSKASLFVLLSEYETHPIALLEAAALGCPALVADTSGLRELAEGGLAQAIPLNSSSIQVANAALDLLRQPIAPKQMALPTWDDCAANLLKLYQDVIFRRG